jgi:hypothetical protein
MRIYFYLDNPGKRMVEYGLKDSYRIKVGKWVTYKNKYTVVKEEDAYETFGLKLKYGNF